MIQLNIEEQIEINKKLNKIEDEILKMNNLGDSLYAISLQFEAHRKTANIYMEEIREKLGLNEAEIIEEDLPF